MYSTQRSHFNKFQIYFYIPLCFVSRTMRGMLLSRAFLPIWISLLVSTPLYAYSGKALKQTKQKAFLFHRLFSSSRHVLVLRSIPMRINSHQHNTLRRLASHERKNKQKALPLLFIHIKIYKHSWTNYQQWISSFTYAVYYCLTPLNTSWARK